MSVYRPPYFELTAEQLASAQEIGREALSDVQQSVLDRAVRDAHRHDRFDALMDAVRPFFADSGWNDVTFTRNDERRRYDIDAKCRCGDLVEVRLDEERLHCTRHPGDLFIDLFEELSRARPPCFESKENRCPACGRKFNRSRLWHTPLWDEVDFGSAFEAVVDYTKATVRTLTTCDRASCRGWARVQQLESRNASRRR
jgi:hypothetical protein